MVVEITLGKRLQIFIYKELLLIMSLVVLINLVQLQLLMFILNLVK